jgi:hypothetical protein
MTAESILVKLRGWSGPLGPFRSPESIFEEMRSFASAIGDANAAAVVDALHASVSDPAIDEEIRSDFFAEYAAKYPAALERALVPTLDARATPLAVLTAGHARARSAGPTIRALALAAAPDDEMIFACITALADIADDAAERALAEIEARGDLSDEARDELRIAKANLAVARRG